MPIPLGSINGARCRGCGKPLPHHEHKANIEKYGEEVANLIYYSAPNMYELCSERVELVASEINKSGKLYNDFESAMPFYQEAGILNGVSPEVKEFNSIMEFLYLGREPQKAIK